MGGIHRWRVACVVRALELSFMVNSGWWVGILVSPPVPWIWVLGLGFGDTKFPKNLFIHSSVLPLKCTEAEFLENRNNYERCASNKVYCQL